MTQMTGRSYCDRGHQLEAGQRVAAVAAADDDGAVGVRHLQADGAVDVPGHRPELAGLAEVLALLELDVVAEPGQVRAGVGEQDRSRRQHPADRLRELAGVDRVRQVR